MVRAGLPEPQLLLQQQHDGDGGAAQLVPPALTLQHHAPQEAHDDVLLLLRPQPSLLAALCVRLPLAAQGAGGAAAGGAPLQDGLLPPSLGDDPPGAACADGVQQLRFKASPAQSCAVVAASAGWSLLHGGGGEQPHGLQLWRGGPDERGGRAAAAPQLLQVLSYELAL